MAARNESSDSGERTKRHIKIICFLIKICWQINGCILICTAGKTMEITITTQNRNDYLLVETQAYIETKEELIEQSKLLYQEFVKHSFKKILIDEKANTFA